MIKLNSFVRLKVDPWIYSKHYKPKCKEYAYQIVTTKNTENFKQIWKITSAAQTKLHKNSCEKL